MHAVPDLIERGSWETIERYQVLDVAAARTHNVIGCSADAAQLAADDGVGADSTVSSSAVT